MATIRQREPGVWEVRVFVGTDERGRPKQVSRTVRGSKRDAQRTAAQLTIAPPSPLAGRTVAEAMDAWLETNTPTWAASTIRDQASRVGLVKRDPIARIEVGRLTVADVDRWHARVRSRGVGEASLRNQHLVLRAGMTQAARWGWVPNNVVALATLGRRKTQPREALSADEVRAAIAAAEARDPEVGLALRLAAVTGARRSELCALRWTDLRQDRLTIDSSIEIVRSGSVGDKRRPTLRDAATKTANRRVVRLDARTIDAFNGLRDARERWGPWVLQTGERPLNPERLTAWWSLARRDAGLDQRWRLHDLRHWSATEAIGRGHDIRTVAGRLGHANPAMTLRTYAHVLDGADAGVAATLATSLDEET
ncbi:MAG: site-specific integrase [Ilumatobacteraceae bacterium]